MYPPNRFPRRFIMAKHSTWCFESNWSLHPRRKFESHLLEPIIYFQQFRFPVRRKLCAYPLCDSCPFRCREDVSLKYRIRPIRFLPELAGWRIPNLRDRHSWFACASYPERMRVRRISAEDAETPVSLANPSKRLPKAQTTGRSLRMEWVDLNGAEREAEAV